MAELMQRDALKIEAAQGARCVIPRLAPIKANMHALVRLEAAPGGEWSIGWRGRDVRGRSSFETQVVVYDQLEEDLWRRPPVPGIRYKFDVQRPLPGLHGRPDSGNRTRRETFAELETEAERRSIRRKNPRRSDLGRVRARLPPGWNRTVVGVERGDSRCVELTADREPATALVASNGGRLRIASSLSRGNVAECAKGAQRVALRTNFSIPHDLSRLDSRRATAGHRTTQTSEAYSLDCVLAKNSG